MKKNSLMQLDPDKIIEMQEVDVRRYKQNLISASEYKKSVMDALIDSTGQPWSVYRINTTPKPQPVGIRARWRHKFQLDKYPDKLKYPKVKHAFR